MTHAPVVRGNLRVPAEDGTALATDVYLPRGLDRAPVLALRTCYGRGAHLAEGLGWARRGFAFVAQDVRGRYDSDGTWTPYRGERADGRALAGWIAAQPWCDGRIVPIGASYAAFTAYALAVSAPVAAVISQVPAMGLHRVKFDPSGILRLAEHVNWWLAHAESRTSRDDLVRRHPPVLDGLPVSGLGERFWARVPGWWSAVEPWANGSADPPPEAITDAELAALSVPSLHVGGWRDLLLPETLHQWRTAGDAASLLVGPWGHELAPLGRTLVGWLERALGGRPPAWRSRMRLVGEDGWRYDVPWPGDRRTWRADAGGGLTGTPAGACRFRCDPRSPFPSIVEGEDRSALAARTDAVRFVSPVLDRPLTVLGAGEVVLTGQTSAASADWIVRLNERRPDGVVRSVASGAVRANGGRARHRIPLTPAGITIPAGAALELEITGSDFPFLARNLGTGADRYTTADTVLAEQTVHVGGEQTSISLPILEEP
ncbi:CocE/NonD family hydrolase [Amycolatopsis anabasis]|uniref:CocE/NonD family hydrolase n=1 Tax=Amycolatopsis anabasis TaxID=1840409 RepID=UPI001C553E69|nr:CocE/NonD family hydrolase [Amycolatopsis anabasis]